MKRLAEVASQGVGSSPATAPSAAACERVAKAGSSDEHSINRSEEEIEELLKCTLQCVKFVRSETSRVFPILVPRQSRIHGMSSSELYEKLRTYPVDQLEDMWRTPP